MSRPPTWMLVVPAWLLLEVIIAVLFGGWYVNLITDMVDRL